MLPIVGAIGVGAVTLLSARAFRRTYTRPIPENIAPPGTKFSGTVLGLAQNYSQTYNVPGCPVGYTGILEMNGVRYLVCMT